jgi:hypothetical protein
VSYFSSGCADCPAGPLIAERDNLRAELSSLKAKCSGLESRLAATISGKHVWAIYATYDSIAPDTADMLLAETQQLAKEICDRLNALEDKGGSLAFCDGHEWNKMWVSHRRLVEIGGDDVVHADMGELEKLFAELRDE